MVENLGLQLLSYFFQPFLQQEKERKEWIEEQVRILTKNIKYELVKSGSHVSTAVSVARQLVDEAGIETE